MIELLCPRCKRLMTVDESKAGKVGRCLKCNQKFRVPSDLSAAADDSPEGLPPGKGTLDSRSPKRAPSTKQEVYPDRPPRTDEEIKKQDGYRFEEQLPPAK